VKKIFYLLFFILFSTKLYSEQKDNKFDNYFNIGQMTSYNKSFTLYFKTREKAILAKGEDFNYITDYPQDLYIYNHETKVDKALISYEWFPRKAKSVLQEYDFPVFPEDFAYYLLKDNNTLVMVSAIKNLNKNLEFNINNRELKAYNNIGKLDFIISTYAKSCGYRSFHSKYECYLYKPLISQNLIN
tara:strand:- start:1772 stop:2332 length:561 start_codon:yes stop_codon:yes gene_type:complete